MTGYGRAEASCGAGHLTVEVRAVNHRYLDVRTKFPPELAEHAAHIDALARPLLRRGRVEIIAKASGGMCTDTHLDRDRARTIYGELCAMRDELSPGEPVPLSLLAAVPDLFTRTDAADEAQVRAALERATRDALVRLDEMRTREGAALAQDLDARVARIRQLIAQLTPHTGRIVDEYRERLQRRIASLLEGSGVEVDPGRLEHEVAAFADRADVSEELTRLASHCSQFEALVAEGTGVGRKLDFLLQEMGREANTTGSKISDVEVTRVVLDLKAELERMREQTQNVL